MKLTDIDESFESCLALLDSARDAYSQFKVLLDAEYKNIRLEYVAEPIRGGETVHRYSTTAKPSIKLRKHGYTILSDCRHALDQAVVAASRLLGADPKKNVIYFPFASDREDFDTLFHPKRGRCRDVAATLIPELKKMKPWWRDPHTGEGNEELRMLGKLSGPAKHQVIIDFLPEIRGLKMDLISFSRPLKVVIPPTRLDKFDQTYLNEFATYVRPVKGRTDFILAVTINEGYDYVSDAVVWVEFCAHEAKSLATLPIDMLLKAFIEQTDLAIGQIRSFLVNQAGA